MTIEETRGSGVASTSRTSSNESLAETNNPREEFVMPSKIPPPPNEHPPPYTFV